MLQATAALTTSVRAGKVAAHCCLCGGSSVAASPVLAARLHTFAAAAVPLAPFATISVTLRLVAPTPVSW